MYEFKSNTTQIIETFKKYLTETQDQYGIEKVKVYDTLGNTVAQFRYLLEPGSDKSINSELIELTTLDSEDNLIIRTIHYSQFDLRVKILHCDLQKE